MQFAYLLVWITLPVLLEMVLVSGWPTEQPIKGSMFSSTHCLENKLLWKQYQNVRETEL